MTTVDYSFARPSQGQLAAAGVTLVIRYLTGAGKAITSEELAFHLLNGRHVAFVIENTADDAQGGYAAGVAMAQEALAALATLGLPASQPVYYAVDESITPAAAVPYFQGISSVVHASAVGDYAEGALCQLLDQLGLATFHWQSESTSFPGNATTLPITGLQQTTNPSPVPGSDLDYVLKADVGQYPRPVTPAPTPPPPKPTPAPATPREASMVTCPFGGGMLIARPNGSVYGYGTKWNHGGLTTPPATPIVGICGTPSGDGCWLVEASGEVHALGDGQVYGPGPQHRSAWGLGTTFAVIGILPGGMTNVPTAAYTVWADNEADPQPSAYEITPDGKYAA